MTDPPAHEGPVLHAIARSAYDAVAEDVRPPSLGDEGFIHLSAPSQIAGVCSQRFAGREDLVLLVVDQAALPLPLVWEDSYGAGRAFPHLYAPLPTAAVTAVVAYRPGPDGTFAAPDLP